MQEGENSNLGNASEQLNANKYIERLRAKTHEERLKEVVYVSNKLYASVTLGIPDLTQYYSKVHLWLTLITGFEHRQLSEERPDRFDFPHGNIENHFLDE